MQQHLLWKPVPESIYAVLEWCHPPTLELGFKSDVFPFLRAEVDKVPGLKAAWFPGRGLSPLGLFATSQRGCGCPWIPGSVQAGLDGAWSSLG